MRRHPAVQPGPARDRHPTTGTTAGHRGRRIRAGLTLVAAMAVLAASPRAADAADGRWPAPGRWTGDLPSSTAGAGAGAERWTLDLTAVGGRTDGASAPLRYELRRQPLASPPPRPIDDIGRAVADGDQLRLVGAGADPLRLVREGADLRLLDRAGRPVGSMAPATLRREAPSPREPMALRLALRGEFGGTAEAPVLRLCADGRRLPVAFDGAFAALERAARSVGRPSGAPLLVELEASIEPRPSADAAAGREVPTVVVRRFGAAWPRETCGQPLADTALLGTPWRLVRLDGRPVDAAPGPREPHLVLQTSGEGVRLSGSTGCNRLSGGVELDGDGGLRLVGPATTRMACPGADDLEPRFLQALSRVSGFRIVGSHLDLLDAGAQPVARLEAVGAP